MKKIENSGIICINDKNNITYYVCKITHTLYEDESFSYTFIPNYEIISLIPNDIFQGIPGLDLSLKKDKYIRNITPTFISERVPNKNRENLQEMLDEVNLEFIDPINYLINTKKQYSGDNLFVIPYKEKEIVNIDKLSKNNNTHDIIVLIIKKIAKNNDVIYNDILINNTNRKDIFTILYKLFEINYVNNKIKQKEGIKAAKENNKYKGRKSIYVEKIKFLDMLDRINNKEIKINEACKEMNISIDKFYRLKKDIAKLKWYPIAIK